MNNKLLLLIKIHRATLIEQTKTKPQGTLEVKMNKQVETVSFSPQRILQEEGKWLIAVTSIEVINSVFNVTVENYKFQSFYQVIGTPKLLKKTIDE